MDKIEYLQEEPLETGISCPPPPFLIFHESLPLLNFWEAEGRSLGNAGEQCGAAGKEWRRALVAGR